MKAEALLCRNVVGMLFNFIGNTVIHSCVKVELSYEIKTLREDAQLAVRKISLCEPLARGESRKRDSF